MKQIILSMAILAVAISCNKNNNNSGKDYPQIASIVAAGSGFFETEVLVSAVGRDAFIVTDDTGIMMVYKTVTDVREGDKVLLKGNVSTYQTGYTPQFDSDTYYTILSTGNTVNHEPLLLSATTADNWAQHPETLTRAREVEIIGTLNFSAGSTGDKYEFANIRIPSATTAIGSLKYVDNHRYTAAESLTVHVKGYLISVSANKYLNIVPYDVTY